MSRALLLAAAALTLAGCAAYDYGRDREPQVDGMAVEQARRDAQSRCPGGEVRRGSIGDGTSAADWRCERPGRN